MNMLFSIISKLPRGCTFLGLDLSPACSPFPPLAVCRGRAPPPRPQRPWMTWILRSWEKKQTSRLLFGGRQRDSPFFFSCPGLLGIYIWEILGGGKLSDAVVIVIFYRQKFPLSSPTTAVEKHGRSPSCWLPGGSIDHSTLLLRPRPPLLSITIAAVLVWLYK